jgi:hypothetical protein
MKNESDFAFEGERKGVEDGKKKLIYVLERWDNSNQGN